MKIMMVGSIRKKDFQVREVVERIITLTKKLGHRPIHEHFTKISQTDLDSMDDNHDIRFHNKIISNIKTCDIVVSECSEQSLSVGYLLSYAANLGRPIIIFYSKGSEEPNLFPSLTKSSKFFLVEYETLDQLETLVPEYIGYAKEQIDIRFNFFISPLIVNYLDWIAKKKKIPRSVYLRSLIQKDMKNNKDYSI